MIERTEQQLRREQRGWYFYDFANSAFSSTVVTLFLGPWLTELARNAADATGHIYPLGIEVDARSYWSYLISISVLSQLIFLPAVGAMADATTRKKQLLALLAYIGAGATAAMFWLEGTRYLLGGALFLISNLAFGASIVVYNSFLPEIAPESERDSVSSKGWGMGYLGGGLLLALNLLLYQKAEAIGLDEGLAVRISLASAGVWWALFAIIPMATLHNRPPTAAVLADRAQRGMVAGSFLQLFHTLKEISRLK